MPAKYIEAGKIVGTHGVRGEMRVDPWCDSA
ncbi:MAG: 16S rRNA processing protein RimM, partial [Acutalibacteraceae bacterium]